MTAGKGKTAQSQLLKCYNRLIKDKLIDDQSPSQFCLGFFILNIAHHQNEYPYQPIKSPQINSACSIT